MSKTKSRDFWDWTDLVIRIISGIAIPVILGYLGMQLRFEQQENQKTNQVRTTIEHLTSDNWRERYMGVKLMKHYQTKEKGYPRKLISAIVSVLNTEKNPKVLKEAAKRFNEVDLRKELDESSKSTSKLKNLQEQIRFYIHINRERQREKAIRVLDSLNNRKTGELKPINVMGVERVDNVPSNTELRYFDSDNNSFANKIEHYLEKRFNMEVNSRDLTDQFGRIPNHFELWITPE